MLPLPVPLVLIFLRFALLTMAALGGGAAQAAGGPDPVQGTDVIGDVLEGSRAVPRRGATGEGRPGASARTECAREDQIQLNLTAWKTSLKRAETPARRDELLRELGLSLSPGDTDTSDGPEGVSAAGHEEVTLLAIDDSPVHLQSGRFPDHVIDVRFQIQTSAGKTVAHLVQVLRPLGAPDWCRLGIDLSRREGEDSRLETYALGFVPLLDARTKAIEVQVVDSRLRRSETSRQYWVTDGFKLAKVFDQQIGSMDNANNGRETTARIGNLALLGGFPRRIELKQVTKQVVCRTLAEDAPCSESEGSASTTFVYNGKIYVRRGK